MQDVAIQETPKPPRHHIIDNFYEDAQKYLAEYDEGLKKNPSLALSQKKQESNAACIQIIRDIVTSKPESLVEQRETLVLNVNQIERPLWSFLFFANLDPITSLKMKLQSLLNQPQLSADRLLRYEKKYFQACTLALRKELKPASGSVMNHDVSLVENQNEPRAEDRGAAEEVAVVASTGIGIDLAAPATIKEFKEQNQLLFNILARMVEQNTELKAQNKALKAQNKILKEEKAASLESACERHKTIQKSGIQLLEKEQTRSFQASVLLLPASLEPAAASVAVGASVTLPPAHVASQARMFAGGEKKSESGKPLVASAGKCERSNEILLVSLT